MRNIIRTLINEGVETEDIVAITKYLMEEYEVNEDMGNDASAPNNNNDKLAKKTKIDFDKVQFADNGPYKPKPWDVTPNNNEQGN